MTKAAHCQPTEHDFDKFDDATIYCRRCGEQRVMDGQVPPYPTWLGPNVLCPNCGWSQVNVGTGISAVTTSDNVTYTLNKELPNA